MTDSAHETLYAGLMHRGVYNGQGYPGAETYG